MAFLSRVVSFLCRPSFSRRPKEKHTAKHQTRRPSFRRRATKPVQSLTVSFPQTASEWSKTTSKLFETTALLPPPPVPTRLPPSVPHKATFHSQRPSQTTIMALRGSPIPRSLNEPLSAAAVVDIIHSVGRAFKDMPYAVCGLAAMVHYGFDRREPWQVSLVCPAEAQENMRCWAVARGMRRLLLPDDNDDGCHDGIVGSPDRAAGYRRRERDIFVLTTQGGTDRRIRIKFASDFSGLRRTFSATVEAWVLTLPSIADQVAMGYVQSLLLPGSGGDGDGSARRQQLFAGDMDWLLHHMIGLPPSSVHYLRAERVPHIVDRNFWLPFTLSFPGALECFAVAGLAAPGEERSSYLLESSSSDSDTHTPQHSRRWRHHVPGDQDPRKDSARSWLRALKVAFSGMIRRLSRPSMK